MQIRHVPKASLGEMLSRGLTDVPPILNNAAAPSGKDRVIDLHHRHTHTEEPPDERGRLTRQKKEHAIGAERPWNLHAVKTKVKHTPARPSDMVIDAAFEDLTFPTKGQQDRPATAGDVMGGAGGGLVHKAIIEQADRPRHNIRPELRQKCIKVSAMLEYTRSG